MPASPEPMSATEIAKVYATLGLTTEADRKRFTDMKRDRIATNVVPIFPAGGSSLPPTTN